MGLSSEIQFSFIIIFFWGALIFKLARQLQNNGKATNYLLIIRCGTSEFLICCLMNHGTFLMLIMNQYTLPALIFLILSYSSHPSSNSSNTYTLTRIVVLSWAFLLNISRMLSLESLLCDSLYSEF